LIFLFSKNACVKTINIHKAAPIAIEISIKKEINKKIEIKKIKKIKIQKI